MAATKLVEPYVRTKEVIHDYPILLDIDGSCNVGGVIIAPTGPRLSYISGPKDFIEKYTVDGNIPRNADITFLNAYYMSFSAGMVIARSLNTTACGGVYFYKKKKTISNLYISSQPNSIWGCSFKGNDDEKWRYYFNCPTGKFKDFQTLIKNDLASENPEFVLDKITEVKDGKGVLAIDPKKDADHLVYCADFNALAAELTKLLNGGVAYNAIKACLTSVDITIPEPADKINILIQSETLDGDDVVVGDKIPFKDGVDLHLYKDFTLRVTKDNFRDGSYVFEMGTMIYYHGAVTTLEKYQDYSQLKINSITDIVSSISNMPGLSCEIASDTWSTSGTEIILRVRYSEGNEVEFKEGENTTVESTEEVDAYEVDGELRKPYFWLYAHNPEDRDKYKVELIPDEGNLFVMRITDADEVEEYTVSLDQDALDQSGNNCYIENLNSYGMDYSVVVSTEYDYQDFYAFKIPAKVIMSFGDSGVSLSASKMTQNKISAIYALDDQEMYDIEYLAPFGETNLQFIKNFIYVGKRRYWFTPADIPYNKTNVNSIRGYFLNVDDTSNAIGLGPFDKNVGLTGWMFYLAASTLYYTRIMNNRAAGKEWAPVFDLTNGVLDYTNPVCLLGKEDRTSLLNFKCPVNYVKYDQRHECYYFNDNWTHQFERNIMSEEQNRRCNNKIKKDCERLLQSFKGRFNTITTRQDVVSVLEYYFRTNIMNQQYCPDSFQIQCDEKNNTNEIIWANKLAVAVRVRFHNAIKYIDVLNDVYPIGVDFEA